MSIDLANVPHVPIQIGVAGENSFRTITFDASKWGADYPDATYTVVYRRSDGYLYPVLVNASADAIVWSPTETDTAVSGNGQLEVRLLDGETIGKTIIMQTYVAPSLSGDESEPSTPAPDWVNDVADDADRAEDAVEHYPQIVNGVWFVWDAEQSEFVSTGISAQGEDGVSPTVTVTAIEGGHRVTITDATGAHTFDVLDGQGGGSSDAVLYTEQTLTESQKAQARGNIGAGTYIKPSGGIPDSDIASAATWNAKGTYSKPSGGIPASDLAAGVIPTVPQMATQADMSDWTSGKTIDAAVLKAGFQNALVQLGDVEGEVARKANASDIPTAVSDLTNDSDYQTAAEVQTAIAATAATKANSATGSNGAADKAVSIPMGHLDATSTATVMTATVDGITELRDGVCMWLRNGVITSASGFTLNVNGLGAKPCYSSLAAESRSTTIFNVNYALLMIYNSTRVSGGCWDIVYGVDTNTTYTLPKLGFGYAVCTTAAATAAKTASISSYALTTGGIVSIHFDNDVPSGATLNISSKGAKAIYYRGAAITDGVIKAGDTATFVYSTYYHLISIDRSESAPIQTVKVNGTALTPDANKAVDVPVATKTSELENDSGFINAAGAAAAAPVQSVNGKTGAVVLKTSDIENDSGYVPASAIVTEGNTVIDDTLSVPGAAADAETVGSLFTLMDMPMKQSVNWENGQWSQVHVWTDNAARVSPNPSVSVKKGDVLNVKIANGEKFAIGVWTVSGGTYTNREYGSYQFSDLTRTFQMDCEVSVVIAKTSDAAFTPSDVATKVEFYSIPEEQSIVEKVNKLSETAVEDGVPFEYAYEWGEVALGRNAYEAYPSGANANRERARAKQEYIRKVPVTASTVTVTIPAELMCNGKYKIGWAFYGNNFDQLSGTVKGWYTSATTFTATIPSNAVYYMIYIATTSNQYSVDLSEIDYTAASIVFDNSSANQAKMDWFKHFDPPSGAVPLTKDPFLFSVNHRGYSTDAPENTLPAFVLSRKKGFRYVEADVLFTSDEVPVILHDDTINRTARNADGTVIGSTTAIADITFAQARTYDFGIWKGSAYAGTKIPSFAEFIQLCKQLSLTPLIELKDLTTWTDERIESVAALINAVGMQDHVAFISFSADALSKMSAYFPSATLGLGFQETYSVANITALATTASGLKNGRNRVCVSVNYTNMTTEMYDVVESAGLNSFVWTVNSERACASLHRNVIGVLSDSLNAGQIIEDALINS